MNTHAFLEVFTWIWIIGGILLLPFNSLISGGLFCLKFGIDHDAWFRFIKKLCVLQIAWNLVFLFTSLFLGYAEKGKITYTLTRTQPDLDLNVHIWDYQFYCETAKGKTEISEDDPKATPFQKAMFATGYGEGLDPKGLHVPTRIDNLTGKPDYVDTSSTYLRYKFYELSYDEASAYIDRYNAIHNTNPVQDIMLVIVSAVVAPFIWLIP